jgi:hypothetical protein
MKRIVLALALLAATTAFGDAVKKGAPISDVKVTPLADVLANPDAYADKNVVVEGVVVANCTEMGCWMQLAPTADAKSSMRASFKGFFIPTTSKGMKARAEGTVSVGTLTKDEADHFEHEGAKLNRNADGTAKEVTFFATGVELTK